ncbi:MAG: metal-dependent hydrolase [Rubrivivax sp.]|nr:metal-dependent hydrolase [Rubrivivax sp.]
MTTELTVRRLSIDLDTPVPRHWCGGDAFRTALFNALSMSFPAGEQLFIDSVKKGLAALPAERREAFGGEVQGFIGQEATHRRVHERFNAHLAAQGLVNHWERRIAARRKRLLEPVNEPRAWVGVTAATEHWTAIFAQHLLAHPWLLQGAEPRLVALWQWHSAEELEHRSTAFDLYRALGGNEKWRKRLFRIVSFNFVLDTARQTVNNLWRDGTLFKPGTWASAWRTLFGREGLVRCSVKPWREYLRPTFHPQQGDGSGGQRWLAANAALVPPVRQPA